MKRRRRKKKNTQFYVDLDAIDLINNGGGFSFTGVAGDRKSIVVGASSSFIWQNLEWFRSEIKLCSNFSSTFVTVNGSAVIAHDV